MPKFLIIFGALFGCLLLGLAWHFRGQYHAHAILSGSMQPAIAEGSLVLTRALAPNLYQPGDIVTFYIPARGLHTVTHRIQARRLNEHGVEVIQTKGDANTNGDAWAIRPGNIVGKVVLQVPYLGYLVAGLRTVGGFVLASLISFIGVICMLYLAYRPLRASKKLA